MKVVTKNPLVCLSLQLLGVCPPGSLNGSERPVKSSSRRASFLPLPSFSQSKSVDIHLHHL